MTSPITYLSKRYSFSASHRLYTDSLSFKENQQIFGKCANPNGHGHNYYLTVTLKNAIDPSSGFAFPLESLDSIVFKEVLNIYDHQYLNIDVEDYFKCVPTGENIALKIWERLNPSLSDLLWTVTLDETRNNHFVYPTRTKGFKLCHPNILS